MPVRLDAGLAAFAWLAQSKGWSEYKAFLNSKRYSLLQGMPIKIGEIGCDPGRSPAGFVRFSQSCNRQAIGLQLSMPGVYVPGRRCKPPHCAARCSCPGCGRVYDFSALSSSVFNILSLLSVVANGSRKRLKSTRQGAGPVVIFQIRQSLCKRIYCFSFTQFLQVCKYSCSNC